VTAARGAHIATAGRPEYGDAAMKIDLKRRLFIGTKVDSKLREALGGIGPGERGFVTKEDGPYLRLVDGDGDTYLGKILEPGLHLDAVDDVRRNIVSIMSRVCGGKVPKLNLSFYCCEDDSLIIAAPRPAAETENRDPDRDDRDDGGFHKRY